MRGRIRSFIEFEMSCSYRFPLLEGVIILLVYLTFIGPAIISPQLGLEVSSSTTWTSSDIIFHNDAFLDARLRGEVPSVVMGIFFMIILIIPMLVAFTIANSFENDSLRTYLSYPVSRSMVLISRILMIVLAYGGTLTVSYLLSFYIGFGVVLNPDTIGLVILGVWLFTLLVTSSTTLVAITTKKSSVTTIVGVLLWFAIAMSLYSENLYGVLRGMVNPLREVTVFVVGSSTALSMSTLIVGMILSLFLSILTIIASLELFDRTEI
ncbi:MAG: hypothetical protein RTU30_16170 [Candidatus Thorarchaeota archaeon]